MRWVKVAKNGETGATLIVVTLATLVLFGFAALAVDVGNGMAERRRAQSTVDASVLAAAVEATLQGSTLGDAVEQARLFADKNAPAIISDAAWLNDCPDTENPDDKLDITASDLHQLDLSSPSYVILDPHCISFNSTFDEIRVSLPQQIVETYFTTYGLSVPPLQPSPSTESQHHGLRHPNPRCGYRQQGLVHARSRPGAQLRQAQPEHRRALIHRHRVRHAARDAVRPDHVTGRQPRRHTGMDRRADQMSLPAEPETPIGPSGARHDCRRVAKASACTTDRRRRRPRTRRPLDLLGRGKWSGR